MVASIREPPPCHSSHFITVSKEETKCSTIQMSYNVILPCTILSLFSFAIKRGKSTWYFFELRKKLYIKLVAKLIGSQDNDISQPKDIHSEQNETVWSANTWNKQMIYWTRIIIFTKINTNVKISRMVMLLWQNVTKCSGQILSNLS